MDASSPQPRLAVLIDADNAQPGLADALLAEIAKYGVATVKRVYGDWTLPNLGGWKKTLAQHAIQPIQQFRNTVGKNASDSALIIDAMDLLYGARLDGFCIVSSDSDFTRLASRIRETGLVVYGFGERKTPQAFVSACDKFVYVDVLRGGGRKPPQPATAEAAAAKPAKPAKPAKLPKSVVAEAAPAQPAKPAARRGRKPAAAAAAAVPEPPVVTPDAPAEMPADAPASPADKIDPRRDPALLRLLGEALDDAAGDDGWASLGALGSLVAKRAPDFDSRNYGYRKLRDLVAEIGPFEVEERGGEGRSKTIVVRERRGR